MKQHDFDQVLSQLDTLSARQRHSLIEWLHCPEEIPDIVEHLEQNLHDHLSYIHCDQDKIHRWGMTRKETFNSRNKVHCDYFGCYRQ